MPINRLRQWAGNVTILSGVAIALAVAGDITSTVALLAGALAAAIAGTGVAVAAALDRALPRWAYPAPVTAAAGIALILARAPGAVGDAAVVVTVASLAALGHALRVAARAPAPADAARGASDVTPRRAP